MRFYETVFMARQDLTDTQVKDLMKRFSKLIEDNGGKVHKTEYWGLLNLAYRINKSKKAHYVLLETEAPSAAVQELERNLRLNEDIMRALTVRLEKLSEGPSPIMRKSYDNDSSEKEAA